MNWYYVESGEQRGPVTDADLQALANAGTVQPETLIWSEGMANWQPYREVKPASTPLASAPGGEGPSIEGGGAVCTECGKLFALDEVIKHGNCYVCASCKPIFLQKLKEGVAVNGAFTFAGFWTRFGAKFVDGIILRLMGWALSAAVGVVLLKTNPILSIVAGFGGAMLINIAYNTFFIGKFGQTPGKMAAKVRVINADGSPVGYGKACGRYFAEILSGIILCFGYFMAAWDPEKRALHDRICNTRVVKLD